MSCDQVTMRSGSEPPAIWKVQKALLQKFVPELRDGKRVFSATNSVSKSRHAYTHVHLIFQIIFDYSAIDNIFCFLCMCSILDTLGMPRPCTRGYM